MRRLFQSLVDLFILCPIGHHKNIFASAFDFASHGYNMKPSPLPRFLVNVLKIPLPLLLILNPFQPLHLLQILLNVLILIYLLYRDRPHVQIGHVVLHKPVQHGTGLMQELSQMRNTLLVYCLRHQV